MFDFNFAEDFVLITPKFDTSLNVKIIEKGIDTTDAYENVLIDNSQLEYGNYYKKDILYF